MSKLSIKILKIVMIISLLSMVILGVTNIYVFKSIFSNLQTEAVDIVKDSVNSISEDELQKVILNKSMDSIEYKNLQESMMIFKSDKDIKYLYTMIKGEDNKAYMVVDASLENASPFGEEYELEDAMNKAFNGEVSFTENPVSDEDGTFISAYAPIKDSSGKVIAIVGADKDVATFAYIQTTMLKTAVKIIVAIIALSVILSIILTKKITASVNEVAIGLNKMSQGDLTVSVNVNSKDEIQTISKSIDHVRNNMVEMLSKSKQLCEAVMDGSINLSAASDQMAASSEEVSSAIQEVAKGMNSQSNEMAKINEIMNTFGLKIDGTVKGIGEINSKIEIINSKAQNSNHDLVTLEDGMKELDDSFTVMNQEIKDLGVYLSQIGEVTNLINSIAEQTNLLALNAAIEAARAGETGKGFAVVADEIRKLAEQSKNSASNISSLLDNVTIKSNLVVKTSENMNGKLIEQDKVINNSIKSFKDIIDNVEEIITRINAINNHMNDINIEKVNIIQSVEETASVSEEVSASSEEIAASSQELSASSEEVAAATQELSELSKNMMETMEQFKI